MSFLKNEQSFFSFSKDNKPQMFVDIGQSVKIQTMDCFSNQIKSPEQFDSLNWDRVNPATGAIYINNAKRGDILAVKIKDIQVNSPGVMCVAPKNGVLGDYINTAKAKILQIDGEYIIFDDKIKIKTSPMIGVIGVAPHGDAVSCGTPGSHGGNMDTKRIQKDCTVYLPVFVDGGLFGLGDLHASMGDGEICVSGVEVSGTVDVCFDLIKNTPLSNPMIETKTNYITVASAKTLDEAVKIATHDMANLITKKTNMDFDKATMLMSMCGNARISQAVDSLVTARFEMQKSILEPYFSSLF